jgi:hypothetical protein
VLTGLKALKHRPIERCSLPNVVVFHRPRSLSSLRLLRSSGMALLDAYNQATKFQIFLMTAWRFRDLRTDANARLSG